MHTAPSNNSLLSFENTEYAFAYKNGQELKLANFLFTSMGKSWMLNFGLKIMPLAIKWNLPFSKSAIRKTIFKQFVGGETLQETAPVVEKLAAYDVQVILDYGVEGGGGGEEEYDHAMAEFIRVIEYAASQPNIPFISIKVTGIVCFSLLEKIDAAMQDADGDSLMKRYLAVVSKLQTEEQLEWKRAVTRLMKICDAAVAANIAVLVDAEETWIQDPVDAVTLLMMDTYNKAKARIYNTVQLYRWDRLEFLKKSFDAAKERDFILAVKIVRGAYMEKERARAKELSYTSPIQSSKENTDADYDAAVRFCLSDVERIATIVATHNEQSNMLAAQLIEEQTIPNNHPHIHFSQLYGMSDNITFNLAEKGYFVSKYLPFGPIKDVIPYLMRRAQENSSVGGQTSRELGLLQKELKRRKK